MWKIRSIVVLAVIVAVTLLGVAGVSAGWSWNGWSWNGWNWNSVGDDGQGTDVRTAWKVVPSATGEEVDGDEFNYYTKMKLRYPKGAAFELIEVAGRVEKIKYHPTNSLACEVNGINIEVVYHVDPDNDAQGDTVVAWVTADGVTVGEATGPVDKKLKVFAFIPAPAGVTPDCYDPDYEPDD